MLLSSDDVLKINLLRISLKKCRNEKISLLAIWDAAIELNKKTEKIIFSQAEENRLLEDRSEKDKQIISGLEQSLKREKKKRWPWIGGCIVAALALALK